MKKQYLDAEEKEIMEAIENDEFVPVTGAELKRVASVKSLIRVIFLR